MVKNMSKNQLTIIIVVSCIIAIVGFNFLRGGGSVGIDPFKARSSGPDKAPIKIVEYIDFQCPACAAGYDLLHKKMEEHPDKIFVQIKYFPLGMHRHAFNSARYAECAARQDKFWPFLTDVLKEQPVWKKKFDAEPTFIQIAQKHEIDMEKLNVCLQDPTVNEVILKEKESGVALGIKSTPTYYVNGKMVVGSRSLGDELKNLLETN